MASPSCTGLLATHISLLGIFIASIGLTFLQKTGNLISSINSISLAIPSLIYAFAPSFWNILEVISPVWDIILSFDCSKIIGLFLKVISIKLLTIFYKMVAKNLKRGEIKSDNQCPLIPEHFKDRFISYEWSISFSLF